MRRPLWLRTLIAVWAVWLGATFADPGDLIPCAMHGDHAAHSMAGMNHMGGMQAHASPNGAPGQKKSNTQCTCVGACCSAATISPPTSQVAEISVEEPVAPVNLAALAQDERAPVAAPLHSLPFANGPPVQA